MGPHGLEKFTAIGSCDSDEGLNADTLVDGKWFPSNGLQSIPGANSNWHVPVGQSLLLLGTKGGLACHAPSPRGNFKSSPI